MSFFYSEYINLGIYLFIFFLTFGFSRRLFANLETEFVWFCLGFGGFFEREVAVGRMQVTGSFP